MELLAATSQQCEHLFADKASGTVFCKLRPSRRCQSLITSHQQPLKASEQTTVGSIQGLPASGLRTTISAEPASLHPTGPASQSFLWPCEAQCSVEDPPLLLNAGACTADRGGKMWTSTRFHHQYVPRPQLLRLLLSPFSARHTLLLACC